MTLDPYEAGLGKNAANYAPLSPLSFLARTAAVFPQRTAVIHGDLRLTWHEVYERCCRLASALRRWGLEPGDTVSVMAPNVPAALEAHFGVAMAGGVLNALNYRLDAKAIAFILEHAHSKFLLTDRELFPTMAEALGSLDRSLRVVDIDDPQFAAREPVGRRRPQSDGNRLGETDYESFLAQGDPGFEWSLPDDEWRAVSLNYTSGTTGDPKGVVYHHRGAYLNALSNALSWGMTDKPIYLWTLPMFHCNGWCFPWTVTALAGTHVCLRRVEARAIYQAIAQHRVTHLCGAPIVMQMILNAGEDERVALEHQVEMMTAAAPPPAPVLAEMARQGIRVTHVYGLTETYGPSVVCAWQEPWDRLSMEEQAQLKARQGVNSPVLEGLRVADPKTLEPVASDGKTLGEVLMRGNVVMKGYLKNPEATREALAGGWFHSGDLGVRHPDGYIELKDRSKDIIISGGENISSIEVEAVLYGHPAVAAAAVVARTHEKWGETPCAFVELKPGAAATEAEVIDYCRRNLAHFKCPTSVVFGSLPKTSTGKVRKFVLRHRARELE